MIQLIQKNTGIAGLNLDSSCSYGNFTSHALCDTTRAKHEHKINKAFDLSIKLGRQNARTVRYKKKMGPVVFNC